MEKNKKDLMILIAILFIGVNYAVYTYFITSRLDSVKQAENKYLTQKQKLNDIKVKKQSIEKRKKELEKLKQETVDFDNIVPIKIDTPQLIYDFYNGCKLFGVTGQNISFQLLDNNSDHNNKAPNNTTTNNNNNTNNTNNTNKEVKQGFYTLTIDLKITGDKGNIENFIKNLGTITNRKLNVKSITISSSEDNTALKNSNSAINTQNATNTQSGLSTDNSNVNSTKTQTDADNSQVSINQPTAEVIFYQYIQSDGNSQLKVPNNYEFYNSEKEGFNSISDMFK